MEPNSSSVLGLPYRILSMKPKKELLWSLWVIKHEASASAKGTAQASRLAAGRGSQ